MPAPTDVQWGQAKAPRQGGVPKPNKVKVPKVKSASLTGGTGATANPSGVEWPTQANNQIPFQAPLQQLPASQQAALSSMGPYVQGPGRGMAGPIPKSMGPNATIAGAANKAVANALTQVGDPYIWGAGRGQTNNPNPSGFDCSGFTGWAYGRQGVKLGSTANEQFKTTRRVDQNNMQAGDLVFFNFGRLGAGQADHVAMYMGNGQIVHAANKRTGVQTRRLDGSYLSHVIGAGRPT